MKYKIVIVNYAQVSPSINIINNEDYSFVSVTKEIYDSFKIFSWLADTLFGVHIFECDDLETFDLLKAQEDINTKKLQTDFSRQILALEDYNRGYIEGIKYQAGDTCNRKDEIKRIAERHYIDNGVELSIAIEMATQFVDSFDYEFERLEKQDDKS